MPVLRGLFCYYLFVLGGCFLDLWSVIFGFPPSCICDSACISELVRNTDIVVTTVKGQLMGPKASYGALLL